MKPVLAASELTSLRAEIKNPEFWDWKKLEVREGVTHRNAPVKLVVLKKLMRAKSSVVVALAAVHEGKCVGVRTLEKMSPGFYFLDNGLKQAGEEFEVTDKGRGIGGMLTAEAINRVKRGLGARVMATEIVADWERTLYEKFGGRKDIIGHIFDGLSWGPGLSGNGWKKYLLKKRV